MSDTPLDKPKTIWLDLRCPRCSRWLGSVSGDQSSSLVLKLYCTKCKVECRYRNGKLTIPSLSRQ